MRPSKFVLFAALQHRCWGRQPAFSVHDDVVAYPQFEVLFSDNYIPEHEADALLELGSSTPSKSDKSLVQQTPAPQEQQASDTDDDGFEREVSETYELMNVPPSQYLCTIPVIEQPPPQNQTASELAKAEEARELIRATSAGWQLIRDLENKCLYFVSGWWSYQFCFGVEVVQYHAIQASSKDVPVRDPNLQQYILGRDTDVIEPENYEATPGRDVEAHSDPDAGHLVEVPRNTELVLKGNQRYLVQRLEDGTSCDLTGRPRTIDIQYHCATTGNTDRIGWIKEVTTCAYLMAVYTPRLCKDVAFLPPKPTKAHAITCREILTPEAEEARHERKSLDAKSKNPDAVFEKTPKEPNPTNIGGIIVGSRNILGAADRDGHQARLAPPTNFQRASKKSNTIVIASGKSKDKGGAIEILPNEDIEDLNIDPQLVERVRQELHKYAGDNGWRLEIVDQGGVVEMTAIVMADDGQERQVGLTLGPEDEAKEQEQESYQGGGRQRKNQAAEQKGTADGDKQEPVANTHGGNDDNDDSGGGGDTKSHEGSQEEFFEEEHIRDEL